MECIFNNHFFNSNNKILVNGNYKYINDVSLKDIYNKFNMLEFEK